MSVDRMRAYWVYAVVGLGLLWLACGGVFSSCSAAETSEPEKAAYRVSCGNSGGSGAGIGPGLGVTNAHVVDWTDGNAVTFTHQFTGEQFSGRVVVLDKDADVAICALEGASEVTWVPITPTDPPIGTKLWMFGYGPQRILRGANGTITGANGTRGSGVPVLDVSIVSEPGDSGSGLYNERGELCAVNWGGDGNSAATTPASYVRRAMQWGVENGRISEQQCPGGSCHPRGGGGGGYSGGGGSPMVPISPGQPSAPRPSEPRPPAAPPAKGEPGPKGDKGDPGEPGPPGPQGPPGDATTIDLDALCAKLAESVGCKCDEKEPQPEPEPAPAPSPLPPGSTDPTLSHYTLVADTDDPSWSRTESELVAARAKFKRIHLAHASEIPWDVRTRPQLVAYDTQGAALSIVKGQRDVEMALRRLARGEAP